MKFLATNYTNFHELKTTKPDPIRLFLAFFSVSSIISSLECREIKKSNSIFLKTNYDAFIYIKIIRKEIIEHGTFVYKNHLIPCLAPLPSSFIFRKQYYVFLRFRNNIKTFFDDSDTAFRDAFIRCKYSLCFS